MLLTVSEDRRHLQLSSVWRDAVVGEHESKEFQLALSELALALVQGQTFLTKSLVHGLQVLVVFLKRLSKHYYVVTDVVAPSIPSSVSQITFWKISGALEKQKLRRNNDMPFSQLF